MLCFSTKYIDIHTHNSSNAKEESLIIFSKYENFNVLKEAKYFSCGIHPWHIYNAEEQFEELKKNINSEKILAIGECGLDRNISQDLSEQIKIFEKQIQLAEDVNKPLVIHCVKAFSELFSILKGVKIPVIFHGFNKKEKLANQILKEGYYLSFGKALQHNENLKNTFKGIPLEKIFLETDEANIHISEIYETAISILGINKEDFTLQIQNNFKKIYCR